MYLQVWLEQIDVDNFLHHLT